MVFRNHGGIVKQTEKWLYQGTEIEIVSIYKYLGLYFTPKLIWSKSRLAKCRQISIFAMPVAFTGKYWEIMENTGKYDLQPSMLRLVISIIEVI